LSRIAALGLLTLSLLVTGAITAGIAGQDDFRFVIVGDRTGETVPDVYEQVWREADADHPAFVVTVGDTIQGFNDATTDMEWRDVLRLLEPYRRYPIYFTPGNHDVWSPASAAAYQRYTKRPLHYSFDYGQAHFTVLEEHPEDERTPVQAGEMAFLERDLKEHQKQPLKFVFSHRPWWLIDAVLRNQSAPLQQLAEHYGVQYIIAGHIHQMLHVDVQSVTYLSMPSAGGHLRASKRYQDGWFFAHTLVAVHGTAAEFSIQEVSAPFGQGRKSHPADWGSAGLLNNSLAK
jgi:3',5'-cyclic-AMP phosphodiesterase